MKDLARYAGALRRGRITQGTHYVGDALRRGRIHAPLGSGNACGQGGINAALQKYSVGGAFMRPWVQVMHAARTA